MGGSEAELQDLTTRLEKASGAVGMELSSEKSKILVNSHSQQAATNIMLNGQQLEEVESFKYLGSTLCKDGSSTKEIKARLGLASSAMTRLNTIWNSSSISFPVKFKLYKSLVVSILLYGCELDTDCRHRAKNPGIQTQVLLKVSPHLLPGTQDKRLDSKSALGKPALTSVLPDMLTFDQM